jgi:hypothetical protein
MSATLNNYRQQKPRKSCDNESLDPRAAADSVVFRASDGGYGWVPAMLTADGGG